MVLGLFPLLLLAGGGDLLAQAGGPDCEYAACALRVKGGSLVKGADEEKVIGLGFWVGDMNEAFAGSPLSQELAASFRHKHNVAELLWWTGTVAIGIGLYKSSKPPDDTLTALLGIGGFGMWFGSVFVRRGVRDRLNEAIWEYNRLVN